MKKKFLSALVITLTISLCACGNTAGSVSVSETTISENTQTTVSEASADNGSSTATVSESESSPASTSVSAETAPEEEKGPTLKETFEAHNIKVGTCVNSRMLGMVEHIYFIKDNFSSMTMENAMKPDSILNQTKSRETGNLEVEFSKEATRILEFAKKNGISMRGHTLVWYSQTPEWIFYEGYDVGNSLVSREVMLERLENYIKNVFELIDASGYTDLFYAYDVVNEAWMEDGSMRNNLWVKTIGSDYLWYAFYFADKYAPESIDLYYNDYNEQYKTETLVKFVNTLVDENGEYLIDGIGLQAHLYTGDDQTAYFKMIDRLSETGLKIEMTELDVCLGSWQNPQKATDDNLKKQGRYYYDLLNGLFERIDAGTLKMDSITFWGYADDLSWRSEYSPLLVDSKLSPKYAFYGALQDKEQAGFSN